MTTTNTIRCSVCLQPFTPTGRADVCDDPVCRGIRKSKQTKQRRAAADPGDPTQAPTLPQAVADRLEHEQDAADRTAALMTREVIGHSPRSTPACRQRTPHMLYEESFPSQVPPVRPWDRLEPWDAEPTSTGRKDRCSLDHKLKIGALKVGVKPEDIYASEAEQTSELDLKDMVSLLDAQANGGEEKAAEVSTVVYERGKASGGKPRGWYTRRGPDDGRSTYFGEDVIPRSGICWETDRDDPAILEAQKWYANLSEEDRKFWLYVE